MYVLFTVFWSYSGVKWEGDMIFSNAGNLIEVQYNTHNDQLVIFNANDVKV